MNVQNPFAAGKNLPPPSFPTPEQVAFRRGANGLPCTYNSGHMRRVWARGRAFGEQQRAGLRPIDTVRVVSRPAPAGCP